MSASALPLAGAVGGWSASAAESADRRLALGAAAVLGLGLVLALAGLASGADTMALAGGAAAALALVTLVAAGLVSGALVVALAAPLPGLQQGPDSRLTVVAPLAAAVIVAWALRRALEPTPIAWDAIPRRTLLALLTAFALGTLFAADLGLAARKSLSFMIMAGLLLVATDELARERELRRMLLDTLVACAGACGLLAVLEALRIIPGEFLRWGTPFNRAALGFGQPNALGLYLAVLLPLVVYRVAVSSGAVRVLALLALAATTLGLAATFSRTSWIAIVVAVAALAVAGERRLALRMGLVLALAGGAVELVSGGMLSDTAQRTVGDWVVEQRAALFLAGVRMFLAHPLLGIGPGGFADQVEAYGAQIPDLWDYQATPHNAYVQMAAETGIVGLAAFAAFLGALLLRLLAAVRRAPAAARALPLALFCSFATLCTSALGVWPFAHGTGEVAMLVLALGLACAADPVGDVVASRPS